MTTFNLRDYTHERLLVLEIQNTTEEAGNYLHVNLRLFDKDKSILFEINTELAPAMFHNIFDWLENLSSESEDLVIPELNLRFEWGWFEKGELYYRINVRTPERDYVLFNWYQGDENARLHAEQMRTEFATLREPGNTL